MNLGTITFGDNQDSGIIVPIILNTAKTRRMMPTIYCHPTFERNSNTPGTPYMIAQTSNNLKPLQQVIAHLPINPLMLSA
jgi:hypothetical protein